MDEQHQRCDGCGERFDPRRPNAGDGWGEFYCSHPEVDGLDSVFIGHWQCAQAAGCDELA